MEQTEMENIGQEDFIRRRPIHILKNILKEEENVKKELNVISIIKEDNEIMPTFLQKRRIIYCSDDLWKQIEKKAKLENLSISSALRQLLKKGLNA